MDNQTYLNQISASTRPAKKSNSFFSSNIFKIIIGSVIALALIIIFGAIINNGKTSNKNKCISLYFYTKNLTGIIDTYQPAIKSSTLRGSSASLKSLISSINSEINSYLIDEHEFKEKKADEKIVANENALYEELNNDLFEAKINGLLDRTYARKMAYEISLLRTRELEIHNSNNNEALKQFLSNSYDSLENLYEAFDSFSETK